MTAVRSGRSRLRSRARMGGAAVPGRADCFACGRYPAPRPTSSSCIRRSNASRCGRRASNCPTAELATQDGARLLSEALRLSLRRGAGPFRSAARVGFEPRAYQLVPLLMALRLPVVRLLIADDVGIGKTIEAGLILRELIDRGEVDRFAVLCPPHLVEQWTGELQDEVRPRRGGGDRRPRQPGWNAGCRASQTLFDAHPYTVVSLDYIKADRRRDSFARACPELVVVDEAHACVGTHQSRQQRFELLKRLAEDHERHLMLLDRHAAQRRRGRIRSPARPARSELCRRRARRVKHSRIRLARHFVQRGAIDITGRDWGEERVFPRHETARAPLRLSTPEHQRLPRRRARLLPRRRRGRRAGPASAAAGLLGHAGADALRRLVACRGGQRAAQPSCRGSRSAGRTGVRRRRRRGGCRRCRAGARPRRSRDRSRALWRRPRA